MDAKLQELKTSILMALDDAYSDDEDMDAACKQISDYMTECDGQDHTELVQEVYDEWKLDCIMYGVE